MFPKHRNILQKWHLWKIPRLILNWGAKVRVARTSKTKLEQQDRQGSSFFGRQGVIQKILFMEKHPCWLNCNFCCLILSSTFLGRSSSGRSPFWLRLTWCLLSIPATHSHACYRNSTPKDCMHVKSFINYWCNFQRLVNERLSPWEQVQSCNLYASGKVMSVRMSQSALDINENMLLDNANGCLQREDAVRFGTSQTIVPIIKRFSENFIDTLRLKTNNKIILGWM